MQCSFQPLFFRHIVLDPTYPTGKRNVDCSG